MPVTRLIHGVPVLVYSPGETYEVSVRVLEECERRYCLSSETFYRHYRAGILPDGITLSKANRWALMYKIWKAYLNASRDQEKHRMPRVWPSRKGRPGQRGPAFSIWRPGGGIVAWWRLQLA